MEKSKAFERLKKHKEAVKATKRTIELDESATSYALRIGDVTKKVR
jgi:hypothetical protein